MSLIGRCLRLLGRGPGAAVDPVPTEERTPAGLGRVVVHGGGHEPAPVVEGVPAAVVELPSEGHEPGAYVRIDDRGTPGDETWVGADRCSCGGVLVAGPRGRAICRALGER